MPSEEIKLQDCPAMKLQHLQASDRAKYWPRAGISVINTANGTLQFRN
jgi:hypothetical protein